MLSPLMHPQLGAIPATSGAISGGQGNITIVVQPASVNLDGRTLANNQLPYIVSAIRQNTGTRY